MRAKNEAKIFHSWSWLSPQLGFKSSYQPIMIAYFSPLDVEAALIKGGRVLRASLVFASAGAP